MKVYDSKTGEIHPDYRGNGDAPKQPKVGDEFRKVIHGGMKPCRVCRKSVAANARACPHCGIKNPGHGSIQHSVNSVANAMIGIGIVAALLLMLFTCSFG